MNDHNHNLIKGDNILQRWALWEVKEAEEAETYTGDPERAKGHGLISEQGIVPLTFFLQSEKQYHNSKSQNKLKLLEKESSFIPSHKTNAGT